MKDDEAEARSLGLALLKASRTYEDFLIPRTEGRLRVRRFPPHRRAIIGLVGRQRRFLRAAYTLADAGLALEAIGPLRSMFKSLVCQRWLAPDPDRNWKLWMAEDHGARDLWRKRLSEHAPALHDAAAASLTLDGSRPVVRVRRAYVKGRFKPPKSRSGKRAEPIDFTLVRKLRAARGEHEERDLVFASERGTPLDYGNLHARVLSPTVEEAGVPWAGFHSLRHTCASRLFAAARNAVQVQRWLGHHSPAFTLSVYVHLLNDDLGGPLAAPEMSAPASAEPLTIAV